MAASVPTCLCGDGAGSARAVPDGRCRVVGCAAAQVAEDVLYPALGGSTRRPAAAWCAGHRYLNWGLSDYLPWPRGDGRPMCAGCRPWLEAERYGADPLPGGVLGDYPGLMAENFYAGRTGGADTREPMYSPERLCIDGDTLERLGRERRGRDAAEARKATHRRLLRLAGGGPPGLEAFVAEGCGWFRAQTDAVCAALRRLGAAGPEDLTAAALGRLGIVEPGDPPAAGASLRLTPAAEAEAGISAFVVWQLAAAAATFYDSPEIAAALSAAAATFYDPPENVAAFSAAAPRPDGGRRVP